MSICWGSTAHICWGSTAHGAGWRDACLAGENSARALGWEDGRGRAVVVQEHQETCGCVCKEGPHAKARITMPRSNNNEARVWDGRRYARPLRSVVLLPFAGKCAASMADDRRSAASAGRMRGHWAISHAPLHVHMPWAGIGVCLQVARMMRYQQPGNGAMLIQ